MVRLSWLIYNSSTACLHFPVLGSDVLSVSILCNRGQTVDGDGGTARLSDPGGRSTASDGHGELVGVGATLLFQVPHTQLQFLVRCDRSVSIYSIYHFFTRKEELDMRASLVLPAHKIHT